MLRLIVLLSLGVLLSCGTALADYDSCVAKSEQIFNECVDKAEKLVNDIEIQDAKAACGHAQGSARSACDDEEVNRGVVTAPDPDQQQ